MLFCHNPNLLRISNNNFNLFLKVAALYVVAEISTTYIRIIYRFLIDCTDDISGSTSNIVVTMCFNTCLEKSIHQGIAFDVELVLFTWYVHYIRRNSLSNCTNEFKQEFNWYGIASDGSKMAKPSSAWLFVYDLTHFHEGQSRN